MRAMIPAAGTLRAPGAGVPRARSLIPLIFVAACGAEAVGPGQETSDPPKADAPQQDAGPRAPDAPATADAAPQAVVEVRLQPSGRLALATGEEVPLRVVAVDGRGVERDVTSAATFAARNPEAASVQGGVLLAGPTGSRATTVIASFGGVAAQPLLV